MARTYKRDKNGRFASKGGPGSVKWAKSSILIRHGEKQSATSKIVRIYQPRANLIAASKQREKEMAQRMSGGTSKFVYMGAVKKGTVGSVARIRKPVSETAALVKTFGKRTYSHNPESLKKAYVSFLKSKRVR